MNRLMIYCLIGLPLSVVDGECSAAEIDEMRPSLPTGSWQPLRTRMVGEDGTMQDMPNDDQKIRICFDRKNYHVFKGASRKPMETGEFKVLRLPEDGVGLLQIKDGRANMTMHVLYRFHGDRFELCVNMGDPDKGPTHFGAKQSMVVEMIPSQHDRVISAYRAILPPKPVITEFKQVR